MAPVDGKGVDDIGKINQLSLRIPRLGCPGAVPRLSLWCPLAAPWIPWTSKLMTRRFFVENDNLQGLGSQAASKRAIAGIGLEGPQKTPAPPGDHGAWCSCAAIG